MRLAVFDTNVLISAGIRRGSPPAELVTDWVLEGLVLLATCPAAITEYMDVFARPKFSRYLFPPTWLQFLIDESLRLPDPPAWRHPCPDPSDGLFLSLAEVSGAWLVSGNLRHFPASARGAVTVLSPAAYLDHLRRVRT